MFNDSVLSVLNRNCSIGAGKVRHVSKRAQKIIPGQPILQLYVERNSPSDDQPSSSNELKKKTYTQKNQMKKEKPKKISLLMTMTGFVQAVVKFGTMTEIVAG